MKSTGMPTRALSAKAITNTPQMPEHFHESEDPCGVAGQDVSDFFKVSWAEMVSVRDLIV